jgi:hypothetical protein
MPSRDNGTKRPDRLTRVSVGFGETDLTGRTASLPLRPMTGTRSMLGQPAGWYQDPAPVNPSAPETVRFWDGANWTGQVRVASKKERLEWRRRIEAENREYARRLVARAQAGDPEAQQILAGPPRGAGTRTTTPDGQAVSGWWRRFFAQWVDDVIVAILGTMLSWPWLRQVTEAMNSYLDRAVSAAQAGIDPPSTASFVDEIAGPMMMIVLVYFLLGFVFEVGFLKGFNATPGKMLVGNEVRLRETPGALPWKAVLLRWLGKRGYAVLGVIPFVFLLTGLYYVIDVLWPVGDSKRQALHDKMAATNVVRR